MKKTLVLFVLFCLSFLSYAQGYKTYFDQGQKMYNDGLYEDAITLFESAKLKVGSDNSALNLVNDWLSRARRAKTSYEQFTVPEESVNFFSSGGVKEVPVTTGSPLIVVSMPEWCSVESAAGMLTFTAMPNPDMQSREGSVTVRMTIPKMSSRGKAKQKEATISVHQDERVPQVRTVMFHTNPSGVTVTFPDDDLKGASTQSFSLSEGSHRVVLTKNNYNSYETVVVISPDEPQGTKYIDVNMAPKFAVVNLSIKSSDVKPLTFESNPRIKIGNYTIDASYVMSNESLSDIGDSDITYGRVYQGGVIPLPEGEYEVVASATGFEPFTGTVTVFEGKPVDFEIVMNPITGTLRIVDGGGADGARILVDRIDMGVVPAVITIPADLHSIVLEKDGYISSERSYAVEVLGGVENSLVVSMSPYTWVSFNSKPEGASLSLDNQVYNTPTGWKKVPRGEHNIHIEKEGYMPENHTISVLGDSLILSFKLQESHPLRISTDADDLYVTLINEANQLIVSDSLMPSNLNIPYGKYKVEFHRYPAHFENLNTYAKAVAQYKARMEEMNGMKDLAYKGHFNFTPKVQSIRRQAFSSNGYFNFFHATYLPTAKEIAVEDLPSVKTRASGSFLRFSPFSGYTTSLLSGSLFEASSPIMGKDDELKPVTLVPWATALFLNGEIRLGGAITDFLDIDILGSYGWLPHVKDAAISLTYADGLQLFLGLELNTRLPIGDVSFKVGEQYWNGYINVFDSKSGSKIKMSSYPFSQQAFTIGVSFGLGSLESKGQSIARLWH